MKKSNILEYLDKELNVYYDINKTYPKLIVMNKQTYEIYNKALEEFDLQDCWRYFGLINYKGILIRFDDTIENIKLI